MTRKTDGVSSSHPAFYADTGSLRRDLIALLHPPYTAWHLSYVVYGAALAPALDRLALAGTLAAFFFGTGVAAHAFDEWHGRPLGTRLSDAALLTIAGIGVTGGVGVALLGVSVLSTWVLAWAVVGTVLMLGATRSNGIQRCIQTSASHWPGVAFRCSSGSGRRPAASTGRPYLSRWRPHSSASRSER